MAASNRSSSAAVLSPSPELLRVRRVREARDRYVCLVNRLVILMPADSEQLVVSEDPDVAQELDHLAAMVVGVDAQRLALDLTLDPRAETAPWSDR